MSTDLAEAAAMDSEERPVEAAAAYERAIARGFGDIETFQDLWALYLSCLDMGFYSAHHLSDEFVNRCNRRYSALIDMAESRFGPSDIIAFWRHYHLWRTLGDEAAEAPLHEIYARGQVPEACVVSGDTDRACLMKRLHQLHDLCRGGETERKRNFGALAQSILMMHGVEPVLHFDPRDVVRLLRRLPTQLQAAFALACADRLAPAYVAFVRASGRGPDRLAPIRERLWRRIAGEADDSSGAIADIEACMSLIPAADDAGWVAEQPAADDAAAALTHALRAWDTHDPQEAVRAAQRCYSAVERHVLASQGGTEIDRGRSNELVRSPLFQAELKRQDRDLHYLARLGPPHNAQRLSRLRDRAKRESQFMFALDPERMPKDGRK